MADPTGKRHLGHWQLWWALYYTCLHPFQDWSLWSQLLRLLIADIPQLSSLLGLALSWRQTLHPWSCPFLQVHSLHPMTGWWDSIKACFLAPIWKNSEGPASEFPMWSAEAFLLPHHNPISSFYLILLIFLTRKVLIPSTLLNINVLHSVFMVEFAFQEKLACNNDLAQLLFQAISGLLESWDCLKYWISHSSCISHISTPKQCLSKRGIFYLELWASKCEWRTDSQDLTWVAEGKWNISETSGLRRKI